MSDFGLKLENHYARLPGDFYTLMPAEKVGVRRACCMPMPARRR